MIEHFAVGWHVAWFALAPFVVGSAVHVLWVIDGQDDLKPGRIVAIGITCVWTGGGLILQGQELAVISGLIERWNLWVEWVGTGLVLVGGLCLIHGLGQFFAGKHTALYALAVVLVSFWLAVWASMSGLF